MTTVSPTTFTKVDYDAAHLAALFDRARGLVPEVPAEAAVELRFDEDRATSSARLVSRDPWVAELDGGSVEDMQRPRTVSENQALVTFCRLLFEIADRLDPAFGAPAVGEPSDPPLRVAWDTYCVARTARRGVRIHEPRYRYNFRNRVGFTDAADDCFNRLWAGNGLTWDQIEDLVRRAHPPAPPS